MLQGFMTKLKSFFNKINKSIVVSIRNYGFVMVVALLWVCFEPLWFRLFDSYINCYFLSEFACNWVTTILFILATLFVLWQVVVSFIRRIVITDIQIAWALLLVVVWIYYRINLDNAYPVYGVSLICYVDIIPFIACSVIFRAFSRLRKGNSNKSSDIGFIVDEPITRKEEDCLNRRPLARNLIDKLMSTEPKEGSFSLGIVAPWGEGKTSFMELMKNYADEKYHDSVITLSFNPWLYSKSGNLTTLFLNELQKKLSVYHRGLSKDITSYICQLTSVDNFWVKLVFALLSVANQDNPEELKKRIEDAIEILNKRVVIFVDDLDRLDKEELVKILSLVRNSSNFKGLYFVLAFDDKQVNEMLGQLFGSQGVDYMNKIIQEKFVIPSVQRTHLRNLLLFSFDQRLQSSECKKLHDLVFNQLLYPIDIIGYFKSIRDVKRFVNIVSTSISRLHGEVDICDYVLLELFRMRYPLVADALIRDRDKVLVYDNNKFVYFDGTNNPNQDDKIWFEKKEYYNLIDSVQNNPEQYHIGIVDKDPIKEFMNALFGPHKTSNIGSINHERYIKRYFDFSLRESDVSEVEFEKLWNSPFKSMQPILSNWMLTKSYSLVERLEEINPSSQGECEKLLHALFFIGSLENVKSIPSYDFVYSKIMQLQNWHEPKKEYTAENKEFVKNLLFENQNKKYSLDLLRHLLETFGNFETCCFDREEIIDIQAQLFDAYVNKGEHSLKEIMEYWDRLIRREFELDMNGTTRVVYRCPDNANQRMKELAKENIELFLSYVISSRTFTTKEYTIAGKVSEIWGGWDVFQDYIMSIPEPTTAIVEFQVFLKTCKEVNFEKYVPFEFKHMKING